MAIDLEPPPEQQSMPTLLGGIVNDLQTLLKQQFQLTRKEIHSDLVKARKAAIFGAIGGALCGLGALILSLTLALAIHWSVSPAGMDKGSIPLWGCFALVGVPLMACGATMCGLCMKKAESMTPLLEKSTQALEENLEWTSKATTNTNRN